MGRKTGKSNGRPSDPNGARRERIAVAVMVAALFLYEGLAQAIGYVPQTGLIPLGAFIFVCVWAGFRAGIVSSVLLSGYVAFVNLSTYSAIQKTRDQSFWGIFWAIAGSFIFYSLVAVIAGVVHYKLRTARRRESTAQESAEREAELRTVIVDSALDAIIVIQEDGRITLWNPSAERKFGWTADEIVGKTLSDTIIPSQYRQKHVEGLRDYLENGAASIFGKRLELSALRKNGEEFDVELAVAPYKTAEGHYFVGFIRDITDRKKSQAALEELNAGLEDRIAERTSQLERVNTDLKREISHRVRAEDTLKRSRQELQEYIDSMSTMNAKVALDGTILMVNQIGQIASGLSKGELLKTNFLEGQWWSFDSEVQARVKAAFARAKNGEPINYEESLFIFDQVLTVNFSLVPVRDQDGKVEYIIAEGRDVTGMKATEETLRERTVQLEAANKELEAFSHSVSHDLRAPLRAIDGFSLALLDDYGEKFDETGRDYLKRVRAASQRMAQLIDDLLNLSRVTRTEMKRQRVSLSNLATGIAAELKKMEPDRKVDLKIQSGVSTDADPRLLRIVMQNLIDNSWKFTGKSSEKALIEFGLRETDKGKTYFVRDNGAGFDMAYVGRLFGAFQRLHSMSEFTGTGVGLATVARIVQRHGGEVWAEGEVGKGATFYFTLQADGTEG